MFQISKEIGFDYGHRVQFHKSKCFHPHGHRARVVAYCDADNVISGGEQTGMVLDFSFLKEVLTSYVHDALDHKFIISIHDDKMMDVFFPNITNYSHLENQLKGKNFLKIVNPAGFNMVIIEPTPTAENFAKLIFNEIKEEIRSRSNQNATLTKIEFWETPTSCAFYSE